MSINVTTAMVQQFSANVEHLVQQKGSVLRNAVRVEMVAGETGYFDQIGVTEARKRTGRHQPTELADVPHARRVVVPEDYDWAEVIDPLDKAKMITDPTGKYSQSCQWAFGRAIDDAVIAAADATATIGRLGGSTVAFDSTNMQVAAASAGLTLAKILAAAENLNQYDVDMADRHIAVHSKQLTDVLGDSTITSNDFNTVKLLMTGQINQFMGFTWHLCNRLGTDSSDNRKVLYWQRNGLLLGINKDIKTQINVRADLKGDPQQISGVLSCGATRMQEHLVGRILCVES